MLLLIYFFLFLLLLLLLLSELAVVLISVRVMEEKLKTLLELLLYLQEWSSRYLLNSSSRPPALEVAVDIRTQCVRIKTKRKDNQSGQQKSGQESWQESTWRHDIIKGKHCDILFL
jgi:hypothetical protein